MDQARLGGHACLLGGVLPQWKDGRGDTREQRDRAKAVARSVATMQMLAAARVKAHRKRAAKATQWVRDREQARPMLQLMLRAWAGVARTGAAARVAGAPMLGPEDRILDDEQYKQLKLLGNVQLRALCCTFCRLELHLLSHRDVSHGTMQHSSCPG